MLRIPVAHDFVCEWCWIGLFQMRRLREEFEVDFDWKGYELYPEGLVADSVSAETPLPPDKPLTPSRLTLALEAAGLEPVRASNPKPFTKRAHLAVEYAKQFGDSTAFIERIYHAYWKNKADISEFQVILECAKGLVENLDELKRSIEEEKFIDQIILFDDPAHENGVWNLPTYWIGGERFSEQPLSRIRKALSNVSAQKYVDEIPYDVLEFPKNLNSFRPYIFINMVSTVDGKIITGQRGESVHDLGSSTDHRAMRMIQSAADAVLIGGGSQRSSDKITYPENLIRIVISSSGNLLFQSRFFEDFPSKVIVAIPNKSNAAIPENYKVIRFDTLNELTGILRTEYGVQRLLIEGGSTTNAEFIRLGLIDEIFLTLAPKIKLGESVPTLAGGIPFDRMKIPNLSLVSAKQIGNELFLRYRFTAGTPTT